MRGASLTRFKLDDQFGGGFLRNMVGSSLREGWKGLKMGGVHGLPNIAGGVRGIKRGGRRAVKRKAQKIVKRNVKRGLDDIFGK